MESALQILSSVLNGSREWLKAASDRGLRADDFADPNHQEIWRAVERLLVQGRGIRLGSVETELRGNVHATQVAREVSLRGPSFQTPAVHIECVMAARLRTDAVSVLADVSLSLVGIEKVEDFQQRVREGASRLDALALNVSAAARDNTFLPVFDRTLGEMQTQLDAQKSGKAPWITTGVPELDRAIGGGWQRPGAYVLVGMSGRGKTHIGVHFALEAARAGAAVVYFTVEMPQSQIMRRMMANAAMIPSSSIAAVDISEDEMKRLQHIPDTHGRYRLAIEDNFRAELERLTSLIRKYRRAGHLDVAVIDYVQQLIPSRKYATKQQDMLAVAHELKQVCIQEGIVMIQLAQANREAEMAEHLGHRLSAQHIEHSHAIYQNADAVVFYQNIERKEKGFADNRVETIREEILWIAKNRHGESNKAVLVELDFETSTLRSYARR